MIANSPNSLVTGLQMALLIRYAVEAGTGVDEDASGIARPTGAFAGVHVGQGPPRMVPKSAEIAPDVCKRKC